MRSKTDIQADVTARIIEALENDLLPWRRPWKCHPNSGLCTSLSTGNCYQGINQILLQLASLQFGYESKWFGTFCQIKAAGANVRKGEKGIRIVLFKPISRTRVDASGDEHEDTFCVMRSFVVFNVEQTSGLDQYRVGEANDTRNEFEQHEEAERVIRATGCRINYGGPKAFYSIQTDEITLPHRHQFESPESYYETAFHELSHWAEKRTGLDRSQPGNSYGFAELVAEISACQLMAELRLATKTSVENSAAYVKHWLKAIRQDKNFIFKAAAQASKAADFILSFSRKPEEIAVG